MSDKDTSKQPDPVHVEGGESIHDIGIRILQERKEFGLQKYGTPLQVDNGRDWPKDMVDEAADQFVYTVGLGEMYKGLEVRVEELEAEIRSSEGLRKMLMKVSYETGIELETSQQQVKALREALVSVNRHGDIAEVYRIVRTALVATVPEFATKPDESWFHGNNPDCLGHNDK